MVGRTHHSLPQGLGSIHGFSHAKMRTAERIGRHGRSRQTKANNANNASERQLVILSKRGEFDRTKRCDQKSIRQNWRITYYYMQERDYMPEPPHIPKTPQNTAYTFPEDPSKHRNLRLGVSSSTFFTRFHTFKSYASPICPTGSSGQVS